MRTRDGRELRRGAKGAAAGGGALRSLPRHPPLEYRHPEPGVVRPERAVALTGPHAGRQSSSPGPGKRGSGTSGGRTLRPRLPSVRKGADPPGGSTRRAAANGTGRSIPCFRSSSSDRPPRVDAPAPGGAVRPPPGAPSSSSDAFRSRPQEVVRIWIVRPLDSGAFGMWTRSTPFRKVAVIASAEMVRGSLKERSNRPKRRSRRW